MTLTTTSDKLFDGTLVIEQPARGYRVNIDSLLLASFAAARRARVCVDLGAGVGAVGLALHHMGAVRRLELVELEPDLCELARLNLERAGASGAVHALDVARGLSVALRQSADLVVCNPPFYDPKEARPAKQRLTQQARVGSVGPFLAAAAAALAGPRARVAFAYPARSLQTLLAAAGTVGLVAKRLRLVHPKSDAPARLALVELLRAKNGGLVVLPPLCEWESSGRRSRELEAVTRGLAGDRK